jgi:hypothetical protein
MDFRILIAGFLSGTLLWSPLGIPRALASTVPAAEPVPYGMAIGYTDSVETEVSSEPQEMLLMEKPDILSGPSIHDRIFNNELSSEFTTRYQETFGRTEQENNYFLISQQGYYMSPNGLTATQEDQQRRAFAEYMMRRLIEFHTENIMKNDPKFKQVYEIKQAVSNFKMEVGPQVRFDLSYSFVGNFARATVHNPWLHTYATIEMDPASYTPTAPREVFVQIHRPLGKAYYSDFGYRLYSKAFQVTLTKAISPTVSVNLSEIIYLTDVEIDYTREGLTLGGLSIVF